MKHYRTPLAKEKNKKNSTKKKEKEIKMYSEYSTLANLNLLYI